VKGMAIKMKIFKTILLLMIIITLVSLFGCIQAGSRADSLDKSSTTESAGTDTQRESWKAPSGGEMLMTEMPQPDKNSGPYSIAAAINDTVYAYDISVYKGFEKYAKEYPNLKFNLFDCKNNPDDALKAVLDIQNINPDLVVFYSWVGGGQEMAKWCNENKKPQIELEVPYNENAWFYGINNPMVGVLAGQKMGEWVKANWAGKDVTVIQNTEYESGDNVYLRNSEFLKAFLEKVGDSANIVNLKDGKVDEINGDTSPELGLKLMSEWLTAHPDSKNIVAYSMTDEAGTGMYAAAKNASRLDDVIFGSIGGTDALHIIVDDTRYIGAVAVFPELYGEGALKTAINILNGEEVPKKIVGKLEWVTKDNIGDFYPEYLK
jgi:ABC-type sugar transport system substrate-binding protein